MEAVVDVGSFDIKIVLKCLVPAPYITVDLVCIFSDVQAMDGWTFDDIYFCYGCLFESLV